MRPPEYSVLHCTGHQSTANEYCNANDSIHQCYLQSKASANVLTASLLTASLQTASVLTARVQQRIQQRDRQQRDRQQRDRQQRDRQHSPTLPPEYNVHQRTDRQCTANAYSNVTNSIHQRDLSLTLPPEYSKRVRQPYTATAYSHVTTAFTNAASRECVQQRGCPHSHLFFLIIRSNNFKTIYIFYIVMNIKYLILIINNFTMKNAREASE